MRSFEIIERVGDLGIARYLDNKKYTFVNMKTGDVAFTEFDSIKYTYTYPFTEDGKVLHSEYYDLSYFEVVENGHYSKLSSTGDLIIYEDLFEDVYKSMVTDGCEAAIRNIDFKNFEPSSCKFTDIKAAINAYLKTTCKVIKNVEKVDEKIAEYCSYYDEAVMNEIIIQKQHEFQMYALNMKGDEFEVEDPENPTTKPINVIDMTFDKDIAAVKNSEPQM